MEEDNMRSEMEMDMETEPVERYPNFTTDKFSFLMQNEEDEEMLVCNFDHLRPVKCILGLLEMAHGSVKLYQGDTCIICAVYGPSDVRMSKELPHRAAVDVLYRPKITGTSQLCQNSHIDSTWEERTIENIITGILESTIILEDDLGAGFNVILHEYENDGCLLSTCINAVSIALMKAGCSIRHPIAAVTVAFTKDSRMIIDPNSAQLSIGWQALMTFVFNNQGHLLYSNLQGFASKAIILLAISQAQASSSELFRFQSKLIRHDNLHELGDKDGEDCEEEKDNSVLEDEEPTTKLNFTDLKVGDSDSDDVYSDKEDVEDD